MTFRDDHDAAIARSEALERELAIAKDKAADAETRAREAEADRARLEQEVARLRPREPEPPSPRIVDADRPRRYRRTPAGRELVMGIVTAALFFIVFTLVYLAMIK